MAFKQRQLTILAIWLFASTVGRASGETDVRLKADVIAAANNGIAIEAVMGPKTWEAILRVPISEKLEVGLGKTALSMGPGRHDHPILSKTASPYPLVYSSGKGVAVRWEQFVGALDASESRLLSGHRLEGSLGPLTLGVAETAVTKGETSWAFYLPLPAFPLQLRQFFFDRSSGDIDLHADFYGIYQAGFGDLYAEWYVDHIAGLPWERADRPTATGFVLGYASNGRTPLGPEIGLEYVKIGAYTYTHRGIGNYVHQGLPLGSDVGPSSDKLTVDASKELKNGWNIGLVGSLWRRGEWEIGDAWSSAKEREAGFPAGLPEYHNSLNLVLAKQLSTVLLQGSLGADYTVNKGHIEGENTVTPRVSLGVSAGFSCERRDYGPGFYGSPSWDDSISKPALPVYMAVGQSSYDGSGALTAELVINDFLNRPLVLMGSGVLQMDMEKVFGLGRMSLGWSAFDWGNWKAIPFVGLGYQGYGNPKSQEDLRVEADVGVRLAKPLGTTKLRLVASVEAGISRTINDLMDDSYLEPLESKKVLGVVRGGFGFEYDIGAFRLTAGLMTQPTNDFGTYQVPKFSGKLALGRNF